MNHESSRHRLVLRAFVLCASVVVTWLVMADDEVLLGSKHWAFQPMKRVSVPAAKVAMRVRSPIDRFVFAKLAEQNLSLNPEADWRR